MNGKEALTPSPDNKRGLLRRLLYRLVDLSTGDGIALAGLFGSIAAAFLGYSQQKSAIEVQDRISMREKSQAELSMVVGILSEKPGLKDEFSDGAKVLRRWSVDVLNDNHSIKIPPDLKEVLVSGEASLRGFQFFGSDYATYETITLGGEPLTLGREPLLLGDEKADKPPGKAKEATDADKSKPPND